MDNWADDREVRPRNDPAKGNRGRPGRRKTIHIKDVFLLLWGKKLLVLAFVVVVVSVTAFYTWKSPKLYKATTRLVIEKETFNLLPSKNILAVDTSTTDYYNTQHKILRSRTLAQNIINVLRLKVTDPTGTDRPMHYAELLRKIVVSPLRDTRLVDVSVVDGDAKRAAEIANTVAQEFIRLNVSSELESRKAAALTIKKQLDEVASQVQEAEARFNEFKSSRNIVSIEEKHNLVLKDLTALTDAASSARAQRGSAEAVYNRIKDLPREELKEQPEVAPDNAIQRLEGESQVAQTQLKALSRKYGSKHPRILEQQVVLEGIVEHIYRRAEAIRERLKNAWLAAEENEADAMQALEEAKKRVHEFEATATEYRRHEMEVETNKKMYEALLSRRMESVVETGATRAPTEWEQGTSNIRVIDRAVAPGSPFRPRPLVNMSLAVFVGLALGCGTAFFVVYLDDKVRTPDDVTEDLGKSLLAEIPFARERSATERSRSLVTYEHPDRAVSEAYRNLRTNVQLLGRDGNFPSVLVTSACHGEGKTTTAVNLAITIAQAGRKVLIVDTDMRRPRMHRHFGIDESVGLIRYFSGEASLEDVMVDKSELVNPRQPRERPDTPAGVQEVRRAGRLEQGELWVLPCGERRVSNPTEVIGSRMMQELMADLRKRFDVVIFDSPPCNFSDPLILAKMVNGVLVVVEAGKFGKSLIMQGLDNLDRVEGGKVFGVILNKYDPKKSATYGYYGYRSYYYTYDRYHHSRRGQGFWHRLLYRSPADKGARTTRKRRGSSPGGDAVA